jgi:integrative and conjugative element protein (TIGR02256 family)
MSIRRCEIANQGRLGILSVEGPERNPRLDDLQVHLLDHARRDQGVSAWLGRHRAETEQLVGPMLEEIGLGIGCSSTTMRLRDDLVALHAANFASALRSPCSKGGVFLVHAALDGVFTSNTQHVDVGPTTVIQAEGTVGWSARVGARAMGAIQAQLRAGRAAERGGILVGLIHRKRRIVYVTDAIAPSRDSRGTSRFFVRGVRDYPELLLEVEDRTGGILGYVGEWHTHPKGPSSPSPRDMASVRELAVSLRPAGLPAHILILSPGGLTCHVEF